MHEYLKVAMNKESLNDMQPKLLPGSHQHFEKGGNSNSLYSTSVRTLIQWFYSPQAINNESVVMLTDGAHNIEI